MGTLIAIEKQFWTHQSYRATPGSFYVSLLSAKQHLSLRSRDNTSHVLCTCAFLIWIFNESISNCANVLILYHLKTQYTLLCVKKSAQTYKSCQRYQLWQFKVSMTREL